LAKNEDVVFIEASAKEGHNIKTLFRRLATQLPGMDSANIGDNNNLLEITLDPTPANGGQDGAGGGGGCAC
jgi:Ras-related protein Rab-6A